MGKEMVGTVIEKYFRPPPGAPDKYWCYLMVSVDSGERKTIRLHQKYVDKVTIGDRIHFVKPLRRNKRVRNIAVIEAVDI